MIKLNLPGNNVSVTPIEPAIGNIYLNQKGFYNLLFRETRHNFEAMVFDAQGNFHKTASYAYHYWAERVPIGYASEIPVFEIDVDWIFEK